VHSPPDDELQPEHLAMLEHYLRTRPVLDHVTVSAVPQETRDRLSEIRERIHPSVDPPPAVRELLPGIRAPGPSPDLRAQRLLAALSHVEDGLGAVHYHRARISELEARITAYCRSALRDMGSLPGSTAGVRVPLLGYEYAAFLLAVRRTLDYLAGGVAALHSSQCGSIRKLARSLRNADPGVRAAVDQELVSGLPELGRVVRAGDEQSVRDRVAHYESVDPGTLNIHWTPDGQVTLTLVGGAEELPSLAEADSDTPLAEQLGVLIEATERFVFRLCDAATRDS
jgi:hypothetical protein